MSISKRCASEYKPHYTEYIYALRCPFTWDIFYIGKTKDISTRLQNHIYEGASYYEGKIGTSILNHKKCARLKKIIDNSGVPVIQIIEYKGIWTKIDSLETCIREMYWINFYRNMFDTITNSIYKNTFQYYKSYTAALEADEPPPLWYYHFANGVDGKDIYDRKRLLKDGFVIPDQLDLDRYKYVRETTYDYCYSD